MLFGKRVQRKRSLDALNWSPLAFGCYDLTVDAWARRVQMTKMKMKMELKMGIRIRIRMKDQNDLNSAIGRRLSHSHYVLCILDVCSAYRTSTPAADVYYSHLDLLLYSTVST